MYRCFCWFGVKCVAMSKDSGWAEPLEPHTSSFYCRTVSGSSQPKVPLTLCSQAGRGVTIVSPSSAPLGAALGSVDPSKPLPVCPNSTPPCSLPAAVVSAAHIPTGQYPKVLMHVTSQMTVNQARSAVRTGRITCTHSPNNRVPTGFGKVWKSMENESRVWKNICVSRLVPLFSFLIIENLEFYENKFIVQEVRFHGSCLVIL